VLSTATYYITNAGRRDAASRRRDVQGLGAAAKAVYLHGVFGELAYDQPTDDRLLGMDERGYWTGFQGGTRDGDRYRFWVEGEGSSG